MARMLAVVAMSTTVGFGLAGCDGRSDSTAPPVVTEQDKIAAFEVPAQAKMKESLRDPDSVKYKDVHAYRLVAGGESGYIFCGRVNAKNGFGGYGGYERFVASGGMIGLESQISDFGNVWNKLCPPSNDAGPVAF